MLKCIAITIMKNEEDIVESFVRHNAKFVEKLLIADNMSSDGTRSILESLIDEGYPISIFDDLDPAHNQSEKMNRLYRKYVFGNGYDIVFLLDADELLTINKSALHGMFEKFGRGSVFYIPRKNYLYSGGEREVDHPVLRMRHLDKREQTPKSMIFHGDAECSNYVIGNGNHHVRSNRAIVSRSSDWPFAIIYHYPIRSVNQYITKNLTGWLAMQIRSPDANESAEPIASHWRAHYNRIKKQNCSLTEEQVILNLYGAGGIGARSAGERPYENAMDLRYQDLMTKKSPLFQVLSMYEDTIRLDWECKRQLNQSAQPLRSDTVFVAPKVTSSKPIPLYWWSVKRNFGDLIGPWLVSRITGQPVVNTMGIGSKQEPGLVSVGSLLSSLERPGLDIWGTGSIRPLDETTVAKLQSRRPHAIHAVRGWKTANELRSKLDWKVPSVYGDPALLLPRFFHPKKSAFSNGKIVIVPHFHHKKYFESLNRDEFHIVDVEREMEIVVEEIASSDICLSTSLHGLIVAHAYQIPWVWLRVNEKGLLGGTFKFEDFFTVLDRSKVASAEISALDVNGETIRMLARRAALPRNKFSFDSLLEEFPC